MSKELTHDTIIDTIIEGAQERKGHGITVVDMSLIEDTPVSKFVIIEGNSRQQVAAIAPRQLVTHGQKPPSILWYSQISQIK